MGLALGPCCGCNNCGPCMPPRRDLTLSFDYVNNASQRKTATINLGYSEGSGGDFRWVGGGGTATDFGVFRFDAATAGLRSVRLRCTPDGLRLDLEHHGVQTYSDFPMGSIDYTVTLAAIVDSCSPLAVRFGPPIAVNPEAAYASKYGPVGSITLTSVNLGHYLELLGPPPPYYRIESPVSLLGMTPPGGYINMSLTE